MRSGSWKEAIQHDGYFVVRLRLFTVDEGGQDRHVQSGMKSTWTSSAGSPPLPGLLELPDPAVRSISPGGVEVTHVRPLEPSSWHDLEAGARIGLCKNWPRELGEGVVLERVGVPYECVPPRFPPVASGTSAVAVLRRRTTLGDLIRGGLRKLGRIRDRLHPPTS